MSGSCFVEIYFPHVPGAELCQGKRELAFYPGCSFYSAGSVQHMEVVGQNVECCKYDNFYTVMYESLSFSSLPPRN